MGSLPLSLRFFALYCRCLLLPTPPTAYLIQRVKAGVKTTVKHRMAVVFTPAFTLPPPQTEKTHSMPLIKKQKQEVLKRLSVRIESDLLDTLTAYAGYLESSKDYVIAEAIRYIIDRDKEFAQTLPQIPPQFLPQIPPQNVGKISPQAPTEDPQKKAVIK